jgi:beta-mannanase
MNISRRQFLLATSGTALLAGTSACGSSTPPSSDAKSTSDTTAQPKPLVDRAQIGSYVHVQGVQANPVPPATLKTFEKSLGQRFDIIQYFFAWGAPFAAALNANVPKRELMISWNPSGADITEILKATYDAYIAEYARAAKAYGHPVYIRFAAEMNGNWNTYSSAAAGGPTAAQFVLAWHRVVGIFHAVQADKVKFVWCPTEVDTPDVAGNHAANYWPGAKYVDILGFDAYNWSVGGLTRGGGGWRTFDEMCATGYDTVAALDATLPIWLCETGCPEASSLDPVGVSKGGWFTDMFASVAYPRLKAVVYFSDDDQSLDRNFRIDTTPEAVAGWKKGWLS